MTKITVLAVSLLALVLLKRDTVEAPSPSVISITFEDLTASFDPDLHCMTLNIYREAGWEPHEGQIAVGTVTMNRVRHPNYPSTVCGVVYQRNSRGCQFSWVCQKVSPIIPERYERIEQVARLVLVDSQRHPELRRSLHYHADYVNPDWAEQMTPIKQIGAHIFYRP